jgi:hypothetical protein
VSFQASGAFTSTTIGFVNVIVSGATAGTAVAIQTSAASQTATTGLMVTQSGTTTGYTGNVVQFTGSSTTGQANTLAVIGVHTVLGNTVSITNAAAGQTGAILLNVAQSTTTTGFTGSVVSVTGSHTTGGNTLLVTNVTTTTGNAVSIVANALVAGTSTALLIAHTTSVLGAGNSLVRLSSTSIDTGTTTGTLLDLSQSACVGNTAVLLTDSSADTAARIGFKINVTNAAATGVVPLNIANVAVVSTHFVKMAKFTNGATSITLWLSDNTDPNGALTGALGDVCYNGASHKPAYNTDGGTTWVNFV